ncbi:MerR family transcriptional regulator [Duganella sp. BJB488]|uniref:MerR family transcriptional regulator n=1 Tax=unclassified Duganella TaxID=2636909 RepID=UPI000E341FD6|nr:MULTISPECIES: MerR family transcriptional regulator [unclassified Duganella]RFP23202.1 MerR family transcriptional regulator [Duganella sp. BJB489]RFP24723.1 MerR family transcriptional regulator [Duganella sp. BJB488]RFP34199.1 MerR family transcriptional regulator [Duganella sp. BJB480]
MKIGELAERSGIAASAIRYYERAGLLPKAARGVNGYRTYKEAALERLQLIQIGQNLGFTLEAIRAVTALEGAAFHDGLLHNLDARLGEIEQMMATLSAQRESLLCTRRKLQESCANNDCPQAELKRL